MFDCQNVTLGFRLWSAFDKWIVPMVPGRYTSISLSPSKIALVSKRSWCLFWWLAMVSGVESGVLRIQDSTSNQSSSLQISSPYPSSYRCLWKHVSSTTKSKVLSTWFHWPKRMKSPWSRQVNFWLTHIDPNPSVWCLSKWVKWACLKNEEPLNSPTYIIHFGLFSRKLVDFRVPDLETHPSLVLSMNLLTKKRGPLVRSNSIFQRIHRFRSLCLRVPTEILLVQYWDFLCPNRHLWKKPWKNRALLISDFQLGFSDLKNMENISMCWKKHQNKSVVMEIFWDTRSFWSLWSFEDKFDLDSESCSSLAVKAHWWRDK